MVRMLHLPMARKITRSIGEIENTPLFESPDVLARHINERLNNSHFAHEANTWLYFAHHIGKFRTTPDITDELPAFFPHVTCSTEELNDYVYGAKNMVEFTYDAAIRDSGKRPTPHQLAQYARCQAIQSLKNAGQSHCDTLVETHPLVRIINLIY